MFTLVYVSTEMDHLSTHDLTLLLKQSREKNAHLEVTGMLLYKDGNFMQLLEGEKSVVLALYETIRNDRRHRNVITLYDNEVSVRHFSNWSMGFGNLNEEEAKKIPGYTPFLNAALVPENFSNPNTAQELLLLFRNT